MKNRKRFNRCRLVRWIAIRELRGSHTEYIRGFLYYLPVLLICMVLISTGGIRYDNQRAFLQQMKYEQIVITDPTEQPADQSTDRLADSTADHAPQAESSLASFLVFDATAAAVEERRGLLLYRYQYPAQIFQPLTEDTDFSCTYFQGLFPAEGSTEGLQVIENSTESLRDGEAAVSYDTARALHLREGDEMLLVTEDGSQNLLVTIKKIFPTKYKYGEIGETGTVLLGGTAAGAIASSETVSTVRAGSISPDAQSVMQLFRENSSYMTFREETGSVAQEGSVITRADELAETEGGVNPLHRLLEEGITISLLFPLLGIGLLIRIAVRELNRAFTNLAFRMAVWTAQGCHLSVWNYAFFLLEESRFALCAFCALLVYKYLFVQLLVGEYLRWELLMVFWCMIVCGSIPVPGLVLYRLRSKWKTWNLTKLLTGGGEA